MRRPGQQFSSAYCGGGRQLLQWLGEGPPPVFPQQLTHRLVVRPWDCGRC